MNRRSFIKTALAGLAGLAATKLPKAEVAAAEGFVTTPLIPAHWGPSPEIISLPDGAKLTATTAIEPGLFVVMDDSGGCSGGTYTSLAWEAKDA